ncbi:MAG: RNA polymerase sigma factor [Desulfobacula sp.]|uniref:RNA polymerase sigma factor n=1 Tax=Desulfobacula sp. TaxID=2593537 RepID=UPI0025BC8FAD|nr:RNA polymerase sigma factor [Desulfobacula sp.]MCD4722506.1 RNA polymerase sigma factor [Desulfobacula sp.]
MKEHADIDIVEQILDGKKNWYRFIMDKYQNPIFSLMMRTTGSRSDAEELTQETFMKAYAALHRFDTKKKFFPWLYTIGMNLFRDWKRKDLNQPRASSPFSENQLVDENDFNQELVVTRKEDMALVQKGLSMLPLDYSEVVILRFRYDLSIREISEIFNISMSASKMRIHRGLKQLKQVVCHENK